MRKITTFYGILRNTNEYEGDKRKNVQECTARAEMNAKEYEGNAKK